MMREPKYLLVLLAAVVVGVLIVLTLESLPGGCGPGVAATPVQPPAEDRIEVVSRQSIPWSGGNTGADTVMVLLDKKTGREFIVYMGYGGRSSMCPIEPARGRE